MSSYIKLIDLRGKLTGGTYVGTFTGASTSIFRVRPVMHTGVHSTYRGHRYVHRYVRWYVPRPPVCSGYVQWCVPAFTVRPPVRTVDTGAFTGTSSGAYRRSEYVQWCVPAFTVRPLERTVDVGTFTGTSSDAYRHSEYIQWYVPWTFTGTYQLGIPWTPVCTTGCTLNVPVVVVHTSGRTVNIGTHHWTYRGHRYAPLDVPRTPVHTTGRTVDSGMHH